MAGKDEITTICLDCGEENTASLDKNYFVCEHCGHRNYLDSEKLKDQQRVIIERVFGRKPDNPGDN